MGWVWKLTKLHQAFQLHNARGSVEEVRYFVLLSKELGYISENMAEQLESKYESVSKMLNGLIKSLKT